MKKYFNAFLIFGFFLFCNKISAQSIEYINVHFLYGSVPLAQYKNQESEWFGGLLGGHVGIELEEDKILNFLPSGKFHIFASKNRHSAYVESTKTEFYGIFDGKATDTKRTIIRIPINAEQKKQLQAISANYLKHPPYDYAFFGMRCGAATYEILGQLDKLPKYSSFMQTATKVFYPKILRKKLIKTAEANGWKITREAGSKRRRWEED